MLQKLQPIRGLENIAYFGVSNMKYSKRLSHNYLRVTTNIVQKLRAYFTCSLVGAKFVGQSHEISNFTVMVAEE